MRRCARRWTPRHAETAGFRELFQPALRLVLTIGLAVAILQQITGINSVFFYAPMIFEQSGIGTDASFLQAVLVGLVNLVFTVLAILTIDRLAGGALHVRLADIACACWFCRTVSDRRPIRWTTKP